VGSFDGTSVTTTGATQAIVGINEGVVAQHSVSAGGYRPGSEFVVSCTVDRPNGRTLLALLWHPVLPAGWTLVSASGDGSPEVQAGDLVFTQNLSADPITFQFVANVPAGEAGVKDIRGTVEYQLDGMANPATVSAEPDPRQVGSILYHSADYRGDSNHGNWVIDGTEANRVLAYWRAGGYHCDVTGLDGYAPGFGDCDRPPRHAADYRNPSCTIDGTEVNRVLAYWRAGAYHADAAGLDGYAPGAVRGMAVLVAQTGAQATERAGEAFALHQAQEAAYAAGGVLHIEGTFEYTGTLLSLLWRPDLPTGWTLGGVTGDGTVEAQMGDIVWLGSLPGSPIHLVFEVYVPA
jgi:hypothetical protein